MKKMKIIVLLVVIMAILITLFSCSIINNKLTEKDIQSAFNKVAPDHVRYILADPKSFNFDAEQLKVAYFGKPFNTIRVKENGTATLDENILYYPIFSDDNMIGIMSFSKISGGVSCSIGRGFSDALAKSINISSGHKVAVFANEKGLFAIDNKNEIYILEAEAVSDSDVQDIKNSGKVKFNTISSDTNTISYSNAAKTKSLQDIAKSVPAK